MLAVLLPLCGHGQLYQSPIPLRGSGQVQTCDTSMHVWFTTAFLPNYGCQFDPQVTAGNTVVQDMVWNYFTGDWGESFNAPLLYYPYQEAYPVCLTVNAFDLVASMPCSTTVCQLITPLPDPVCATMIADFTIESIVGNTITFQDLSTFDNAIGSATWSYGDGVTSASPSNSNTFLGAGPYEVCLTIIAASPPACTSTVCKWLYLGPGDVECPLLVDQGYLLLQSDNLVGVLDTSRTSGMNSSIHWDFGDGTTAEGRVAVHAYGEEGAYPVCGTLRVWGPLLADTCTTTICRSVLTTSQVGINEVSGPDGAWAYPSPNSGALHVMGDPSTITELRLLDQGGRLLLARRLPAGPGPIDLDISDLESGIYVVQVVGPKGARSTRIVKL
ncbi:MAG: T9SS type A sorting domain-containing protein [Flavobacteriales bacterium]|nr:T9SS type A sorting domain-containing protein [Flavobacteriales bacterium]MCC6938248.1 T9SS type A sorting domain-containing protein [Flavobacteriales bacterium]